ncbi:hypothetical protein LHYA1_G007270 [Lachnellula hyalina]|uniref:Uncharacterized protein n=1 Tax=Lachnellula hyalina TaxID=1316788 RepID=A0A8H8QWQ2_9HELO|nr:uncharacterized protein LHYA1_G007270 [Lachnellula hyalina]TVY23926.1 hypothetical protein LHYA1_G007270 [Lachnellula hyalina]
MTIADTKTHLPWDCLFQLENAFLDHPSFPENLAVDASFSNTVLAKGISTWRTAQEASDLPSFEQEFFIPVASDCPTILAIADPQHEGDNHITLLILAWTYILSARWAEIIPGASGPEYSDCEAEWDDKNIPFERAPTGSTTAIIDLGDIDDDAARWWAAVLALEGGWNAYISSEKGHVLHSPWYTKLVSEQRFTLSRGTKSRPLLAQHRAASFATALRYLSSYCEFHEVAEQSHAALAATLLLPVARFDNRTVQLPTPRVRRKARFNKERFNKETVCKTLEWSENLNQLDGLLTLSCNAVGTKALLNSVFFEPEVACNICGAWLQGTFAFLDSDIVQDQHILLRVLMKRDPSLGFLWLGAFVIGAQTRSLQEARQAWWKIDLHVAAWTGTLMSFIQEPVSTLAPETEEISRADECRLLYLSHDQYYTGPPLFPFAPFGSTAIIDTNIDVRQHTQCETSHGLEYKGLTWRCRAGQRVATTIARIPLRAKNGQPTDGNISVTYDNIDNEDDDCSEMVTRNIFTWLRDEDGFSVAERAIREHEWIDNFDSDDDSPITGDAQSTVGGNLHGWLLKTITRRSNSL